VRIGTILTIPALLRSLGADPAEVFAEARIDPALLDDPDNLISYEARGACSAVAWPGPAASTSDSWSASGATCDRWGS